MKVALLPGRNRLVRGCVVIVGALAAAVTVSLAARLVTLPLPLLITTENVAPLSLVLCEGVV